MTSNVTRFGTTSITPETMQRNVSRRLPGVMASIVLGAIGTSAAFAGGVDVSTDEIYTDGVTLTDWEGNPLDINGDGHTDLIVAGNRIGAGDASRYYLGNGDGTFTSPVLLDEGPTAIIIAADLNNDTFLDLVQVRRDLTNLLYFGDGAGGFGDSVELSADMNRSLSIAVGDLDND